MVKKPPIRLLTPPIKNLFTRPAASDGSQAGGSGGGGGGTNAPSFEAIFSEMLKRYLPETVTFEPLDEDVLKEPISNWLRPAYDQAIRSRQERTQRQNAELDADALARGMGTSTYVTDVKDRAFRSEAQDVGALEGDYASTLAGQLYDAMRAQQETKIEVDMFNAEQINRAREKAAAAAQALYGASGHGGGSHTGANGGSQGSGSRGDRLPDGGEPAFAAYARTEKAALCGRRRVRVAERGDPERARTRRVRAAEGAVPRGITKKRKGCSKVTP